MERLYDWVAFIGFWAIGLIIPLWVVYILGNDNGYTEGMRDMLDPKNGWHCERVEQPTESEE